MSTPSIFTLTGTATISGSMAEGDATKSFQSELLLLGIMSSAGDKRKIQALMVAFLNGMKDIGPTWTAFVDKHGLLGKVRSFPIL